MKKINYIELGGSLFIPATHKNLEEVLNAKKYPSLKSLVIDTEDGLKNTSLSIAMKKIQKLLLSYKKEKLLVFIRPRNENVLRELLAFEGITKIDGFILPKFSLENAQKYFDALKPYDFSLMPSIEGRELFNQVELRDLCTIIQTNADKIVLVRYGLEDMLKSLGMRRNCDESAFDLSVTSTVLGNFIALFKSSGFAVSAGVYPCFEDTKGFIQDVKRDLREGLFSKTIIHPNQIDILNELYKVTQLEYDEAVQICKQDEAVFGLNGQMAETATMTPYSLEVIQRAKIYGIKE